ncbi:hypothetical protein I8J29_32180 [Paenibacillus sp. MWE-103]|uniref:Secreted protein n=1 Tax=Paenibacillus artemisiicola TaxID=1172618 RepID=A0ABS3WL35_9BACL|nr:hypothetical protein [Paenibacillus artemisiicola]MBO7748840.1 hypothetical protein [Paenibacillus artemisiicola]
MKAAKWLKWKIGAACAVLLVLVFQFVRSGPQFQQALDRQAAAKGAGPDDLQAQADDGDAVMREWQGQAETPSGDGAWQDQGRGGRRFGRHGGQESRDGSGAMDARPPQSGDGSDTRTSRS